MKPKNDKQRRIVELSAKLPPMTERQLAYASRHCFSHKAVKRSMGYYWQSILICQRHGYIVKDGENWRDMMCLLKRLGKDTHSP